MPDKQMRSGLHMPGHAFEQRLLRRFIEIDHDVSAKYHIETRFYWPLLKQVQLLERDHPTQCRRNPDLAELRAFAAKKPAVKPFLIDAIDAFQRIDARGRGLQCAAVQIRCQNPDVVILNFIDCLSQRYCN